MAAKQFVVTYVEHTVTHLLVKAASATKAREAVESANWPVKRFPSVKVDCLQCGIDTIKPYEKEA